MEKPFASAELLESIKSIPVNKSPGEDGFPSEFYKEFLLTLLLEVLEQSRRDWCFLDSFSQAV